MRRYNPRATRYSDEVLRGWGNRNYAWDFATEVQHELYPGISMTAGYYRNWGGNFRVTDNLSVNPQDYDPYCITAPIDPRLPGGGGYEVCGLYDIRPASFGQSENVVTNASNFYGDADDVTCGVQRSGGSAGSSGRACGTSDFVGVSINTRFASGIQVGGGVDTGRTVIDNCFVIDSPQQLLNCHTVVPFKAHTQIKVYGSLPLPGDILVSGTYQNVPGKPYWADYQVSNAEIAPSLGRNLAACGTRVVCNATVEVPLIHAYTENFLDRRSQLDLRFSKMFRVGSRVRVRANVDAYNIFNANTVLGTVNDYGPSWLQPAATLNTEVDSILSGRLIHFGGELSF